MRRKYYKFDKSNKAAKIFWTFFQTLRQQVGARPAMAMLHTELGTKKKAELTQYINYLDLKATFFGLTCFAAQKQNCEILLRIDNTTAVSYINRMGGIKYPKLNAIAKKIWQWCE